MKFLNLNNKYKVTLVILALIALIVLQVMWGASVFVREFKSPALSTKAKHLLYQYAYLEDRDQKLKVIKEADGLNVIVWPKTGIRFTEQEHLNERILALVTTLFPDYLSLNDKEKQLLLHRFSRLQADIGEKIQENYLINESSSFNPSFIESSPESFGEMSYMWDGYLKRLFYIVKFNEEKGYYTLYFISLSNISEKAAFTKTLLPPFASLFLTLIAILGWGMFLIYRKSQNEKSIKEMLAYQEALSRFVPMEFVKLLDKEDLRDVNFGDFNQREMTILFLDIRDFTTLSEGMSPKENFLFLNSFLKKIGP